MYSNTMRQLKISEKWSGRTRMERTSFLYTYLAVSSWFERKGEAQNYIKL